MTFTDKQSRALKAKLSHRHVKTRTLNGAPISYVEGWHAIAEANRIFGYDAWDRSTLSPSCVWSTLQRGQTVCLYTARVRIKVRAGPLTIVRDGVGTGLGRSPNPEQAHEMALKAAETDATKRALATFGNPFGLALYDKEHAGVSKPHAHQNPAAPAPNSGSPPEKANGQTAKELSGDTQANTQVATRFCQTRFLLKLPEGSETSYDDATTFREAVMEIVNQIATIDDLYRFWEDNVPSFKALRQRSTNQGSTDDPLEPIVTALKARAKELTPTPQDTPNPAHPPAHEPSCTRRLARPKEHRIRDKAHLAYVASHPCCICGRRPAQAHHLRFAQPRAMAMKVSDEFTVPLCAIHHDSLHRTGDERAWWARHGIIEPLKLAERLWTTSQEVGRDEQIVLSQPDLRKYLGEAKTDVDQVPTKPYSARPITATPNASKDEGRADGN